jgi:ketosteroid isomerase-like protein
MRKLPSSAAWLNKSFPLFLAFLMAASSLQAQGIMDVIIPNSAGKPEAIYRAKVRDSVTAALQKWARSLEQRDTAATEAAYATNARSVIGDQGEALTARDIVNQVYKTPLAGAYIDLSIKDFDMSGDLAFASAIMLAPSATGDPLPTSVSALFVFKFDAWHNKWQVRQQFIDWRGGSAGAGETRDGAN